MKILPLHKDLEGYLAKRKLRAKYAKQRRLFEQNFFHPSLNVELMEPKHLRLFSFRIDRKYRAIFIYHSREVVEVVDINNHYR